VLCCPIWTAFQSVPEIEKAIFSLSWPEQRGAAGRSVLPAAFLVASGFAALSVALAQ
jgi:hypothetical protein